MPEFFLELLSEEIPARMQRNAGVLLQKLCVLTFSDWEFSEAKTYFGPRRLAVRANVAAEKPGGFMEFRGPRVSAPSFAVERFAKDHDVSLDELIVEKGYHVLRRPRPTRLARDLISDELPSILSNMLWPKRMRWGQSGDFTWVRPLRRIVCLLDGQTIPIQVGSLTAGNKTEGHRVLAPGEFTVSSADDWKEKLSERFVYADAEQRKRIIREKLQLAAGERGLTIATDEALLEEVNGLTEWPVVLIGEIDLQFMKLPPEVRELSMKVNQKYFALRDGGGKPAAFFAFVANLEALDRGAAIILGNERVLRARLADAEFFWRRDQETTLYDLLPKLDNVVFHSKIGTQRQRASRIASLAQEVAEQLGANGDESADALAAGGLAKADLVTGMVGEFPELQGIMGGYYQGYDKDNIRPIPEAIRTHYQPKGPQDAVPRDIVSASVALADKLDTLREFFRIGEVPTGSGDPYALRRAALGVIRIILENGLTLPLRPLLGGDEKLFAFIFERLRVKLRGEGRRFDILDTVLGAGADDDLVRVMRRVEAVTDFLATPDGANLLTAYRRAANILRIEDAKDGPHRGEAVEGPLTLPEEAELREVLNMTQQDITDHLAAGRYGEAMTTLARLRAPVDAFFDKVTVNAPEPELRLNRLRLLAQLRDTMHRIADFSKIQG